MLEEDVLPKREVEADALVVSELVSEEDALLRQEVEEGTLLV